MTIAQVSEKYGLTQDTLRFYERVGMIPPVNRNKSGIRLALKATAAGWSFLNVCAARACRLK